MLAAVPHRYVTLRADRSGSFITADRRLLAQGYAPGQWAVFDLVGDGDEMVSGPFPTKREAEELVRAPAVTCSFPGCGRAVRAKGLCSGHYKAAAERRELTELRERQEQRRPAVSFRVSERCRAAVKADPDAAREALERWARRRR